MTKGNPLATKQGNVKGAETFEKYEYQYHWALCRLLGQHLDNPEYAIFVELHEDVVLADSLDANKAKFEFNQIKCKSGDAFTVSSLTNIPKGAKNSILGKLVSSSKGKPFKDVISTINLVATNGFHKDMIAKGLKLNVITTSDLNKTTIDGLLAGLKKELGENNLPANLRFIVPDLPSTEHHTHVVGKIAEIIDKIFPQSHSNATNVYRLLIDELHKKGKIQYDFTKWDDLLKNKALTSETVKAVITTNTSIGGLEDTKTAASEIAQALGYKSRLTNKLKNAVERYYGTHVAQPSASRLKLSQIVKQFAGKNPDTEYADLLKQIEDSLSQDIKKLFGDDLNVKAAIVYELTQVDT